MEEKKEKAIEKENGKEESKETAPERNPESKLAVISRPKKRSYRPGEEIDYEGLAFAYDGKPIDAEDLVLEVEEGTAWKADWKKLEVHVRYAGIGEPAITSFTLKRKSWLAAILISAAALCALVAAGIAIWMSLQPVPDTGSYIIPQGDMTDEEAQEMLDDMAERSRITVSLRPAQELTEDGALHVNFVVMEPNNGFSERLEVEQDGQVVYASGVVEPGYRIEWGQSSGAHAGPATATVYAVDGDGLDSGNPVSVEIEIKDA